MDYKYSNPLWGICVRQTCYSTQNEHFYTCSGPTYNMMMMSSYTTETGRAHFILQHKHALGMRKIPMCFLPSRQLRALKLRLSPIQDVQQVGFAGLVKMCHNTDFHTLAASFPTINKQSQALPQNDERDQTNNPFRQPPPPPTARCCSHRCSGDIMIIW